MILKLFLGNSIILLLSVTESFCQLQILLALPALVFLVFFGILVCRLFVSGVDFSLHNHSVLWFDGFSRGLWGLTSTTGHVDDSRLPPCDAGGVSHVQSLNLSEVWPQPQVGLLSYRRKTVTHLLIQ